MKQSIKELLSQGNTEKLLIELILALAHIGLDYDEVVETYRKTIKKTLEENSETKNQTA